MVLPLFSGKSVSNIKPRVIFVYCTAVYKNYSRFTALSTLVVKYLLVFGLTYQKAFRSIGQGRSQDFILGGINFRDLVSMAVISLSLIHI